MSTSSSSANLPPPPFAHSVFTLPRALSQTPPSLVALVTRRVNAQFEEHESTLQVIVQYV